MSRDTRLATYGTLAPGRVNHHQMAGLNGVWSTGRVYGHLVQAGWGSDLGFPGLTLDPQGAPVEVHLFTSDDLTQDWARLDAFEGDGYTRTAVDVETEDGTVPAWIYALTVQ